MDLLENIATELGFQFHLYLVRDELYGSKYAAMTNAQAENSQSTSSSGSGAMPKDQDAGARRDYRPTNPYAGAEVEVESDWEPSNGIFGSFNIFSSSVSFLLPL